MAAGLTEVAVGLSGDASLCFADRLNRYLRCIDQFVETAAGNRIFAAIDHRCSLYIAYGRDASLDCALNYFGELGRFRFQTKNCDHGRCIENHFGRPFSSYRRSPWSPDRYGSLRRVAQSRPISSSRSESLPACCPCTRWSRSRTASVTAWVMLSPVSRESWRASLWASLFLIFRLIVDLLPCISTILP